MKIYDVPVNMQLIKKVKAENEQQAQLIAQSEIEQGNLDDSKTIKTEVQEPTDYEWAFE